MVKRSYCTFEPDCPHASCPSLLCRIGCREGTALFMIRSSVKGLYAIWRIPVSGLPLPSQVDDTYMTLEHHLALYLCWRSKFSMCREWNISKASQLLF